jgi:thiamine biosynthesis lipoprotein
MTPDYDIAFACMGTQARLLVGPPADPSLPPPDVAAERVRAWLEHYDRRLSRFRPDSELTALNADRRETVPASPLLRAAVKAGLWAATVTDGLVDPTLVGALESAGYGTSRAGIRPESLQDALAWAPTREPAAPDPRRLWRLVEVDDTKGTIRRPPGLRLDTGGTGKGLAADSAAALLEGYSRFLIDCGGDIRVGGPAAVAEPYAIEVEHPLSRRRPHVLRLGSGAVATSGIDSRLWRTPDGGYAHHLLGPATGRPAWTGVIAVSAIAPNGLAAETLSKQALLSGPAGGRLALEPGGGRLVHDNGRSELVGPLRVSFRVPETARVAA